MAQTPSAEDFAQSLFLLDGSALAYRAHHAMARSSLTSAKGTLTSAVFGFTADLKRLLKRVTPRYAAIVFDRSEPTFRHREFADYKATREKMPDELVEQLPLIRKAGELLGFPVMDLEGYEADDIIGTLAVAAAARGIPVFIVTADKDFMQLVSERVRLYNIFRKDEDVLIIGQAEVAEKFGVEPRQVADVLALMGDSSDNIPGVPGVGEKGAQRLIQKYGSLEALLDNPGTDVSPKVRQSLADHRAQGLLSKRLATIVTEVPLACTVDDLLYQGPRAAEAASFFLEMGFRTFAEEMVAASAPPVTEVRYTIVGDAAGLDAMLAQLRAAPLVAVDTETTGLDPRHARIVGVSFSAEPGTGWYVPLNADPAVVPDAPGTPQGQAVLERLRPLIESTDIAKCGQNVKYDLLALRQRGVALRGVRIDTILASYLLEPHERERNLDALSLRHLRHRKTKTEELIGRGKDQITMDLVPIEQVGHYACEDADMTLRLAQLFERRLDGEDERLRRLGETIELPLVEVLADMEEAGVRVDAQKLRAMAEELRAQCEDHERAIYELAAGKRFNIDSPRQLGEILFTELKVHEAPGCTVKPKRTQTGWSTGQEILEDLGEFHPLPARILEYRSLKKLLTTYVVPLPDLIDPSTGRIHTSYNQSVAATGRLSSSDPNLQNIPVRTETGRRIREAFVAGDEDHVLLSADYSQVELRILAWLSQDPVLTKAFRDGADIHQDTAARVFGIAPEKVDIGLRSRAKAINFGILYGMGPQRLSRETGLSLDEARTFIARYFEAFPKVGEFLEGLKEQARKQGFVTTILGRKRPIPDIRSDNRAVRAAAENMAVNTPIQGSAADILKVAMSAIHRRLREEKLRARMILTVHDELVFDVPKSELAQVQAMVRREMEGASPLGIPLAVDMGAGPNWAALEDVV